MRKNKLFDFLFLVFFASFYLFTKKNLRSQAKTNSLIFFTQRPVKIIKDQDLIV